MTDKEIELTAEVKRLKEQLRIGIVSGRFNSDNNEENEKVLTAILYEHTCEKELKIREVDYEEVVKDIMEYF
jgi:6,7-dimethyl-8-ribityllumazine synthase